MKLCLRALRRSALFLCVLLFSKSAEASHLYGADLFYTHVSGNSYTITMVIYGDCNINTGAVFLTLSSSSPVIEIYNGFSFSQSVSLVLQSPTTGQEVTPVCPSQLSNTTCVSTSGTVPGVKKFTYSRTVNLGGTSSNWRFVFKGALGASSAGRSNSITNINLGSGGSITGLEATLNNLNAPNSSPTYTTIPTPFFCINKAASYNPGTVDANNDALTYSLVPGIEALTSGTVTYLTGYSATNPLAATGFSFSNTTGQLNFTPNLVQRSLVVTKVEEYRGSVLVGTSMREMTFVVLNNCNNNPPGGNISNVSNGTQTTNTTVSVCQNESSFSFKINPTDLDGNNINVSASGVPTGATFTVINNNTTAPSGTFNWSLNNVTPGTYNFFITYTDDGCPLSSKQTTAYTVTVTPAPKIAFALVSSATCSKKAKFNVTPSNTSSPWVITVLQGSTVVHTITNVTGTQLDSLSPGTYILRVTAANTCSKDTTITIAPPPAIIPAVTMVSPTCNGGNNGSIILTATGGLSPFQYAIGAGTFSSSNVFTGLSAGSYTMHVKDANDCIKDTVVQLLDIPPIDAVINFTKPPCNFYSSGEIVVSAFNGTAPYQYALGAGSFSTVNTFSSLPSGNYVIHIKDAHGCLMDSLFKLPDSISVHANAIVTDILCNGDAAGAITLNAFGATAPYKYKKGAGTLGSTNSWNGLTAGNYSFHIEDVNQCYLDTIVTVVEPPYLTSSTVVTNVSCNGLSDAAITTTGSGGVSPYTYAIGAGAYSAANTFNSLPAGTYTVHIKDANGCIRDTSIIVNEPPVLEFSNIAEITPSCFGFSNGSYTITATGGTTPYNYAVDANPFGASNIIAGLSAGTYTLHIKDANGCTADSIVVLTEPTAIVPAIALKNATCATLANGRIEVSAAGGTPSYLFALNAGPYNTSPVFTPVAAGTYTIHIRDSRNCLKDTVIQVIDSIDVVAAATVTDANCFGDTNGKIVLIPAGGLAPYTFAKGFSGPFTSSNTFDNLGAATYLVKIKDANGCIKDTNIVVAEPTKLVPQISSFNHISCYGFNDGKVSLAATGGTPSYTFGVDAGPYSSTSVIINLFANTYVLHVKDAHGCISDTTLTLTQPDKLEMSVSVKNVLCFGDTSGQVTVTAGKGTPPYSYRTDFGAYKPGNVLTGINAGPHLITVQDSKGCLEDTTVTLTEPDKIIITGLDIVNPTCEGFKDGGVNISGKGGVQPYQYGANGAFGSSGIISSLTEGEYTITIKDQNGCTTDTNITLTGYPHILINGITPKDVKCFGSEDGTIKVDAQGGVQPLAYYIGSQTPVENTFKGLKAASYTVTIIDSKNCKKDTTVTIGSPEQLEVKLTAVRNDCEGFDDGGSVSSEVKGGTPPYYYKWSTVPERYTSEIAGLANGKYMVWVTDANACPDSAVAEVEYNNCCKAFVPSAFTPNNDGKNDKLRILFKGNMTIKQFIIYNRFGQRVFATDDVSEGWDGMFNGEPQDLGTYNYYIQGTCGNTAPRDVEYKGTITLIR